MDVAGALLPFTQVVRPELTIHVQEVLTQAEREDPSKCKNPIPEINEPKNGDDVSSSNLGETPRCVSNVNGSSRSIGRENNAKVSGGKSANHKVRSEISHGAKYGSSQNQA